MLQNKVVKTVRINYKNKALPAVERANKTSHESIRSKQVKTTGAQNLKEKLAHF